MKIIITLALMLLGVVAQAQTKVLISPFVINKGFQIDTAVAVSFRCVSLQIDLQTTNQQPMFYLELNNISGGAVDARNVSYQDMINACTKNGIPENQHSATIASVYAAVFCGTKTQKLASLRAMMDVYGIVVKPDNQQE